MCLIQCDAVDLKQNKYLNQQEEHVSAEWKRRRESFHVRLVTTTRLESGEVCAKQQSVQRQIGNKQTGRWRWSSFSRTVAVCVLVSAMGRSPGFWSSLLPLGGRRGSPQYLRWSHLEVTSQSDDRCSPRSSGPSASRARLPSTSPPPSEEIRSHQIRFRESLRHSPLEPRVGLPASVRSRRPLPFWTPTQDFPSAKMSTNQSPDGARCMYWVTTSGPGRRGFYLVLRGEGAVGDVWGEIRVVDGAEGQAVGPAAAEVSDVNILKEEKEGNGFKPSV